MSSFHGNKLKANRENNDIHHILRSGGSQHVLWVNHAFKQIRRNAIHKSSQGRTDAHNNAIIKSRCAVNQRALYPKRTVNEVQWVIFPTESLDIPLLLLHDYILWKIKKWEMHQFDFLVLISACMWFDIIWSAYHKEHKLKITAMALLCCDIDTCYCKCSSPRKLQKKMQMSQSANYRDNKTR